MLYIIGDSHTHRLGHSADEENYSKCSWDYKAINSSNSECEEFHVSKSVDLPLEIYYSGHRGKSAYSCSFRKGFPYSSGLKEGFPCIQKSINSNTTVMPFFGYIDIKNILPYRKNTQEVVKKYIQHNLDFFKGHKIRFIEPIPQFVDDELGTGKMHFPFEERYFYHKEFIYFLKKELNYLGMKDPISSQEILGVDKFDKSYECHDCQSCLDDEYKGFKLDHLKKEFNRKILDGIIAKML